MQALTLWRLVCFFGLWSHSGVWYALGIVCLTWLVEIIMDAAAA